MAFYGLGWLIQKGDPQVDSQVWSMAPGIDPSIIPKVGHHWVLLPSTVEFTGVVISTVLRGFEGSSPDLLRTCHILRG